MEKESKHNDLTNRLLTIILIVTLIANGIQFYFFKGSSRFDWTTGVISSKGNIVQVSNYNFNRRSFYDLGKNKILDSGWDEINVSEHDVKDTFFPDSLYIGWFSYNERKFYNGSFVLPTEIIETKAIQLGMYPSYNGFNSVLQIISEVKPKGKVVVWIRKFDKNVIGEKFKIGEYQAKETKATWHVFDDRSETDKTSDIDISRKVALVMEEHPYKLEIKLPSGFTLDDSYFKLFNQKIWHFNGREPKTDSILNFLPKEFSLAWRNGRKNFRMQFCFDEDEVLDAFRKESNTLEPLVLELILSDRYDVVKAILRNTKTNSKFVFKDKY